MEEDVNEKANIDFTDSEYYRFNTSVLFCGRGREYSIWNRYGRNNVLTASK